MSTTFLNISLAIESDQGLGLLCADLKDRIEFLLSEEQCSVFSVTWDREQALRAATSNPTLLLEPAKELLEHSEGVMQIFAKLGAPLPKLKKGAPQWRTTKPIWGQVEGLPNSRGKLLATNGILCLIVREDGKWASDWHFDWFKPDKQEEIDALGFPRTERKPRKSPIDKALELYA